MGRDVNGDDLQGRVWSGSNDHRKQSMRTEGQCIDIVEEGISSILIVNQRNAEIIETSLTSDLFDMLSSLGLLRG